ncbi:MAG: response regulator, partial [Candidatus Bathyarchaeota archaeon]|nr:response regulator [Candidatus Bathyarchaeota archaeon]
MATRRILVFDNDEAFLALLQSSLGAYGFEVQMAAPVSDDIHTIKVLNPTAVFMAVDAPDKLGYKLCSKAKKAVGKKVPIILATATVSPDDLALHGKLRYHADVYLDKRSLSRAELLDKLDKLIGLGPRIGPLPREDDKPLQLSDPVKQTPLGEDGSDLLEKVPVEAHKAKDPASQEGLTAGENATMFEFFEHKIESGSDANPVVLGQTGIMGDENVKKDGNNCSDRDRLLVQQESQTEILNQKAAEE